MKTYIAIMQFILAYFSQHVLSTIGVSSKATRVCVTWIAMNRNPMDPWFFNATVNIELEEGYASHYSI